MNQLPPVFSVTHIVTQSGTGSEKRRLTRGVRNAVSRCGGSVWESNPPEPPKAPPSGFEGQSQFLSRFALSRKNGVFRALRVPP